MVNPNRSFNRFRKPHRIKRNRQTVELINRNGDVVCAVEDSWNEDVSRSAQQGTIQTHNLSQTWKLPAVNVPDDVVPETDWVIREQADGTEWRVLSVALRSANLTWHLVCEHMRNHSLKPKLPT